MKPDDGGDNVYISGFRKARFTDGEILWAARVGLKFHALAVEEMKKEVLVCPSDHHTHRCTIWLLLSYSGM